MTGADAHRGKGLIVDPIHRYLVYTRSHGIAGEATEEDLIDTPWVQRLRRIPQLQSARWVFPTAEHSRFPHALGAMHVAGRFAQQLWPSLRAVFPDAFPEGAERQLVLARLGEPASDPVADAAGEVQLGQQSAVQVSQDSAPILFAATAEADVVVLDALTGRVRHVEKHLGQTPWMMLNP